MKKSISKFARNSAVLMSLVLLLSSCVMLRDENGSGSEEKTDNTDVIETSDNIESENTDSKMDEAENTIVTIPENMSDSESSSDSDIIESDDKAENDDVTSEIPDNTESEEKPSADIIDDEKEDVSETKSEIDIMISEALDKMSVEEKVGQMFLPAYSQNAEYNFDTYHFSGYILFASDFEYESAESIKNQLTNLQNKSEYGMFFAVDEEGGTVNRVSRFTQYRSEPFDSPRNIYSYGGMDGIAAYAREKALLLTGLGLNINLAPVCDISTNWSDFMYSRSLGQSPDITSEFVKTVINVSKENGLASCLKHFPGYGSVVDTHVGIGYDYRSYDEIKDYDLVPFIGGIDAGVEMVMLSHIISYAVDSEYPVSVSAKAVKMLRDDLGFDGVLITDDLGMSGILDFCSQGCAALDAINAGADLMCCSNWADQYPAVIDAVRNGNITEERLDESVKRILTMKYNLGIWG